VFATLAAFLSIGALAAGIWWLRGVEARGVSLEALERGFARSGGCSCRPETGSQTRR